MVVSILCQYFLKSRHSLHPSWQATAQGFSAVAGGSAVVASSSAPRGLLSHDVLTPAGQVPGSKIHPRQLWATVRQQPKPQLHIQYKRCPSSSCVTWFLEMTFLPRSLVCVSWWEPAYGRPSTRCGCWVIVSLDWPPAWRGRASTTGRTSSTPWGCSSTSCLGSWTST